MYKILDEHKPGDKISDNKVKDMLDDVHRIQRHFTFPGQDEIYS